MSNAGTILRNSIYLFFSLLLVSSNYSTSGKTMPKVHTVEIMEMKYQLAELRVQKGDTVVWINRDLVAHDVTEEKSRAWTSSVISSGKSSKMAVKQSGNYFCSIHPVMKGKIVVH